MAEEVRQGWHLDKRFPVALIIALAIQLAGGVWAVSQMSFTVDDLALRLAKLEGERDSTLTRLIKIETQISQQTKTLERIEVTLERAFPHRFNQQR